MAPTHHKTIGIVNNCGLGDFIVDLPLISYVRKLYPQCKLVCFIKKNNVPIATISPLIDEVVALSSESKEKYWDFHNINAIKKQKLDISFSSNSKHVLFWCYWAGVKTRIGNGRRLHSYLFCNKRYTRFRKIICHLAISNLEPITVLKAFKAGGIDIFASGSHQYELPILISDHFYPVIQKYKAVPQNNNMIIVHPGAITAENHRFTTSQHIQLIHGLIEKGYHISLTGFGRKEIALCKEIHSEVDLAMCTNLSGKSDNLHDLIKILLSSSATIAAGTGVLHLAAALGLKTIGIYPSVHNYLQGPIRWGPIGKNAISISYNKACNACSKSGLCTCIREDMPIESIVSYIDKFIKSHDISPPSNNCNSLRVSQFPYPTPLFWAPAALK